MTRDYVSPTRHTRVASSRRGARAAALGALTAACLTSTVLVAPAALALHREDGDDPGPQISTLKALLIFGVIPVGICLLIALLVSLPSLARGPRYRPGLGWDGQPEWYGGPGEAADDHGGHGGAQVSGSRKREALTGTIVATGETGDSGEAGDGGSSARW